MSQTTARSDPAVPVLVGVTSVTAVALLWWAGFLVLDSSRSPSPLAGVGYLLAAVAAVPATAALALAVLALVLRRRSPRRARSLGWIGLACALLPVLAMLYLWAPSQGL